MYKTCLVQTTNREDKPRKATCFTNIGTCKSFSVEMFLTVEDQAAAIIISFQHLYRSGQKVPAPAVSLSGFTGEMLTDK